MLKEKLETQRAWRKVDFLYKFYHGYTRMVFTSLWKKVGLDPVLALVIHVGV